MPEVGADTVRLNVPSKTLKTSVVAPPMSTPTDVDPLPLGDRLEDVADRAGRRHDRRVGPLHQLVVARRVRHHVLEEQVVDRVAGRAEVLALQHRPQVVDDREVERLVERRCDERRRVLVAGVDDRQLVRAAEPRLRLAPARSARRSRTTCVVVPPSVPPEIRIMSGRSSRMRWICSCGRRLSFEAMTSMTIAPAPSAARLALAAVISATTPATIICRPPPALEVEM